MNKLLLLITLLLVGCDMRATAYQIDPSERAEAAKFYNAMYTTSMNQGYSISAAAANAERATLRLYGKPVFPPSKPPIP